MEDNQSTIKVAVAGYSVNLRFLLKRHRLASSFANEVVSDENTSLQHVITSRQQVDMLTKALEGQKLTDARKLFGIIPSKESLTADFLSL